MRGKIVVVTMLLSAAILLAYSLWFVGNHTPLDERFNQRRQSLEPTTPGALMLPVRAADYNRASLEIDSLDAAEGRRHGDAEYQDFAGKRIRLEVETTLGTLPPSIESLYAMEVFLARAGGENIGATVIQLHPDAKVPYGYGVYSAPDYTYFEFTWINGGWILRASTRDAGSESLLRFANGYPY